MPEPGEDPYEKIYSVSSDEKWWGMVTPELIDPAGLYSKNNPDADPFVDKFKSLLLKSRAFHKSIGTTGHSCTYANYGSDPSQRSFETVRWRTTQDVSNWPESDILDAPATKKKLTGQVDLSLHGRYVSFYPDNKNEPGDGTVPTPSGKAVERLSGIQEVFELRGFDHQHSYTNSISQKTALYAITKIAQRLILETDGTCKS